MAIRAVIFDMDGTITRPFFDWAAMKAAMGLPPDRPILEAMDALAPDARVRCEAQLAAFEDQAAEQSELNPGAREALAHCTARGLKTALLTRNSARSVEIVLRRHGLRFDTAVTRHCAPPKPAPDALYLIARRLGAPGPPLSTADLVMVGDFDFDILTGRRAGARTILVTNGQPHAFPTRPDLEIATLLDFPAALERLEATA
jgi:HAD superfamily hydrolase (TIGR01509 family)